MNALTNTNEMNMLKLKLIIVVFLLIISCNAQKKNTTSVMGSKVNEHPSLVITKQGVNEIKSQLGTVPLFDKTLAKVKKEVDAEIKFGIEVPIPKDMAGGYTHERHKKNFITLQKAGVLFQILEDEKYAIYIRDMLFEYEKMYKDLPLHPQEKSYARGKIFWQCLNDSNWLVYVSQAYDCVYEWLSERERERVEKNLFRPYANFLSVGTPQFFNRVHNHSTWGNVAVGMIGLVMNDDELVNRALYGIENDNLEVGTKDNDGGFIKVEGQKSGFFANLDEPFSPDGYYTEGPYYQRYAMYPFLIFAEALQNVKPELEIFKYKNGVLLKSVNALLNLTDSEGEFFPLNDGQKGMSYYSRELVTAVDITYHFGGNNPQLLSIAQKQNKVALDNTGLSIAKGIRDGKATSFIKKSINLSDGSDGKKGGVGILRSGKEEAITVVFKYASQGLSHGHYDKLSFSMYEKDEEIIQDYGLARFVNIEQKNGGGYLKENKTWAKQTIAHNTITQNETSHFKGKYEVGNKHYSELYLYDDSNEEIQIISAKEENAYPGTKMHRTLALIKDKNFEKPYVLDIMNVISENKNQYDLPYYYLGQILDVNFDYNVDSVLNSLGKTNGYQHLWKEGAGKSNSGNAKLSWLNNNKFYTLTTITSTDDNLIFARIGAKDPKFNLRRDPAFIVRRNNTQNTTFASIIEPHGKYSAVSEFAENAYSNISDLKIIFNDDTYTAIRIEDVKGGVKILIITNNDTSKENKHNLKINDKNYLWVGSYYYTKLKS